jgi:hypothetical protein
MTVINHSDRQETTILICHLVTCPPSLHSVLLSLSNRSSLHPHPAQAFQHDIFAVSAIKFEYEFHLEIHEPQNKNTPLAYIKMYI